LGSSSKLLRFFVRDILDFQKIKSKKMTKDITKFNLRQCIDEVIMMQDYIAKRSKINILIDYINEDDKDDVITDSLRV
jgi:signal transduction histidine kinase